MSDSNHDSDQKNAEQQVLVPGGGIVLPDQVLPPNLFVLPINSPVPFPTLLAPILVTHPTQVAMIEEAINRHRVIGLLLTREGDVKDNPKFSDLHDVGVVVKIVKRLKMPGGGVNLLVHSMKRFRAKRTLSEHPYIVVETEYFDDRAEKSTEMDALVRATVSQVKKLSEVNPFFTDELRMAMINAPTPGVVADLVAFALALPKSEAQEFLETTSVKERFEKLLLHLRREQELADVQKKITEDVNTKVTKLQREFFLKEQLKTIKKELGVEEDGKEKTVRTFRERIEAAGMPDDVKKIALDEVEKFETISENSPEYNVSRNYLETLVSLPWSIETQDDLDLKHARKVLDEEHYGLEKVKERIIEFLAVRKLKKDPKGSIICLVGPPGVGKTSVGKSIAKTLGRNFFRFSLGGMRDEAEIKGHRRTYVGAMPGKVINGIRRAGSKNAVLMLDEIDKLGHSFQGDPASALLEVLDPEQNNSFLDHYLDVPFDLSKVLFITTANTMTTIPAPLLDRMEVIELPGYTLEEKEDIALKYLIPRELKENGIPQGKLKIEISALRKLIMDYAREPGLRSLQQCLSRICRKSAAQIVSKIEKSARSKSTKTEKFQIEPIRIKESELQNWVGPKRFYNETLERTTSPGVVTGLAWTASGGDILFIEATDLPGSGLLKLTGQMGDVMSESAQIAWSYIKKKAASEFKLKPEDFKSKDIHLHIPAGSIPKDGPSAGITMATALYSLMSNRKSVPKLAMTGELSLIGKVLPVGGIKEKLLAAKRAGIQTVILPKLNEKDLIEVPKYALKDIELVFVSHVNEVFDLALEKEMPRTLGSRFKKRKKTVLTTRTRQNRKKRNLSSPLGDRQTGRRDE